MGRGENARKRKTTALRQQAEKKNKTFYAPEPASSKKKPERSDKGAMPSSLRKLLQLKAAAEGNTKVARAPPSRERSHFSRQPAEGALPNGDIEKNGGVGPTAAAAVAVPGVATAAAAKPVQKSARGKMKQNPFFNQAQPSSLKARKKEFLKKKKQRGKKKKIGNTEAGEDSDESDDPEDRMDKIAAATKPTFAEQADRPISINLKRRHWTDEVDRTANRCTQIYHKQMEQARREAGVAVGGTRSKAATESLRNELVDAYRKHKRGGTDDQEAANPKATLQSLTALVQKDTGA